MDIALWDIAGKAANLRVCRLSGGGVADLACYASLVRYSDPSLVRNNVRRAIGDGFGPLKLHEVEPAVVHAAPRGGRSEVGPVFELTLEVNWAWTLTEARARAAQLKAMDLKWLEELIWPPENHDGLAELPGPAVFHSRRARTCPPS